MLTRFALMSLTCISVVALAGCEASDVKAGHRFKELCDSQAGEHIYKTVEDVDGYLWVSAWDWLGGSEKGKDPAAERTRVSQVNDQYGLVDPYDFNVGVLKGALPSNGYAYVDVLRPDKSLWHYISPVAEHPVRAFPFKISSTQSHYKVTFESIGTKADRDLWIGGGKLVISDIKSGEILAERTGFIRGSAGRLHLENKGPWDGQGSHGSRFRCPYDTQYPWDFIDKVLKPSNRIINRK